MICWNNEFRFPLKMYFLYRVNKNKHRQINK